MDANMTATAQRCLRGAENGGMTFPEIVGTLVSAGFEGYALDFRALSATYYPREGDGTRFSIPRVDADLAPAFDAGAVKAAIGEAQASAPGYSYAGFCRKAVAAGCAGYMVSFPGRRVLYYGRDGETHVEHFPV